MSKFQRNRTTRCEVTDVIKKEPQLFCSNASTRLSPFSWRPTWHWCIVVDPCFIHDNTPMQKVSFITVEKNQTGLWIINSLLFLIRCYNKHGTHFAKSFFIPECSCKIVNTVPSDMFAVSAISLNSILRSDNTILRTFMMFSSLIAAFGRPLHSASVVAVQPCLNSLYQFIDGRFPWSRVRIVFIKPLFRFYWIFPDQKAMFNQLHEILLYPSSKTLRFTSTSIASQRLVRLIWNIDTNLIKVGTSKWRNGFFISVSTVTSRFPFIK